MIVLALSGKIPHLFGASASPQTQQDNG